MNLEDGANVDKRMIDPLLRGEWTWRDDVRFREKEEKENLWERSEPISSDAETNPSKPKDDNKVGSHLINAEGQDFTNKDTNSSDNNNTPGEVG